MWHALRLGTDAPLNRALVMGTEGDDLIPDAGADVVVLARAGNDTIFGSGNDVIIAGPGRDVVYAGLGDSLVLGGQGEDALFGADGDDLVQGGTSYDFLVGDAGNDTLMGGEGADRLVGQPGDDLLIGGEGPDIFAYAFFGIPYADLGHDVIQDFKQGEDRIDIFVPFAALDTDGNGLLDGQDEGVTVARGRTTIDMSAHRGDPPGTDVLVVQGTQGLAAADFLG